MQTLWISCYFYKHFPHFYQENLSLTIIVYKETNKYLLFFQNEWKHHKTVTILLFNHSLKYMIFIINSASPHFLDNIMTASIKLYERFEKLRFWQVQTTPYFWFLMQNCMRKAIYSKKIPQKYMCYVWHRKLIIFV